MVHVRRASGHRSRRVRDAARIALTVWAFWPSYFARLFAQPSPWFGLAWWDWRTHGRRDVFLVALGVLVLYHVSTLTLHRVPLWGAFCAWFLGLPLP